MSEDEGSSGVERTELAEDRTILANERTFAGWMRSSLACIAIGVGFHALFGEIEPDWLPRAIATAFLMLSVLIIVLAERRAAAVIRRLDSHVVRTADRMNLRIIAGTVGTGALVLAGAVWLMP